MLKNTIVGCVDFIINRYFCLYEKRSAFCGCIARLLPVRQGRDSGFGERVSIQQFRRRRSGRTSLGLSENGTAWHNPAPGQTLVGSDYGAWGSQKRMYAPFVARMPDGLWHALWSVNATDRVVAHTSSPDLIHWKPQQYVATATVCAEPELRHDAAAGLYRISWLAPDGTTMEMTTADFRHYSAPAPAAPARPRCAAASRR